LICGQYGHDPFRSLAIPQGGALAFPFHDFAGFANNSGGSVPTRTFVPSSVVIGRFRLSDFGLGKAIESDSADLG
jgi:hypothetical protein